MIAENEFKNPGNQWRGKPFWSWNGKLEKDELLRQIDVMKEMGMGDYERAIADYAQPYNNRGVAYGNLGNYERALADYDRAIALDPDYGNAYRNRGVIYLLADDYQDCAQARADLERYFELVPNALQADVDVIENESARLCPP